MSAYYYHLGVVMTLMRSHLIRFKPCIKCNFKCRKQTHTTLFVTFQTLKTHPNVPELSTFETQFLSGETSGFVPPAKRRVRSRYVVVSRPPIYQALSSSLNVAARASV